jgi:ATP-binding protein involved in chromosome partitioning
MASMMNQRVIGVVENMSYLALTCPHCGESHRHEIFGSGGGATVARTLGTRLGYDVPLLAQIPLDAHLRASGDDGKPLVTTEPDQPAAQALTGLAGTLLRRGRGLLGRQLGLAPAGR